MHLMAVLSFFLLTHSPTTNALTNFLWRRADSVIPISPKEGDTIVAKSNFDILWTANAARNVTISLRQGTADNMTLVHIISPSTPNNGSYAWRYHDDDYLWGTFSDHPSSDCNYAIEFRTGGETFDSDFFTILNADDGGITANMTCPGGGPKSCPSHKTDNSGGISTGALVGGITGTAGGMSLLLGLLFFVALKKDWIVTGKECRRQIDERGMTGELGHFLPNQLVHKPNVPQIGGDSVYQMP